MKIQNSFRLKAKIEIEILLLLKFIEGRILGIINDSNICTGCEGTHFNIVFSGINRSYYCIVCDFVIFIFQT